MTAAPGLLWVAVLPVKALATAKSRLATGSDERRRALARAFAIDTLSALRGSEQMAAIAVVCDDDRLAVTLAAAKVALLAEPGPGGLNGAAKAGITWAAAHHRDAGVIVVPADLPALRTSDVSEVLRRATAHPRTVLGDCEGLGTTMLTGLPGSLPRPRFGPGSFAAHLADGAVGLDATGLDRAARDVDTEQHLNEVRRLGVGSATGRVLAGA